MCELPQCIYVDAGNTMVKLFSCSASAVPNWQDQALAVLTVPSNQWSSPDQAIRHFQHIISALPQHGCAPVVHLCSVLGPSFERVIEQVCKQLGWTLQVMQVQNNALLQTHYKQPAQLGKDRWAACMAVASSTSSNANLVVSFGTATTLDAVVHASLLSKNGVNMSAKWVHLGGFIVPGVDTMLKSLAISTAQLPKAELDWADWPNNTEQAIGAGVARQQVSMVRDVMLSLKESAGQLIPTLWCTGGHVAQLQPALITLGFPVEIFQHAVLRGMLVGQRLGHGRPL
ncbi:MAG TPA: type III pantothenate kinase [Limnobacter sp.]|nr:type III pantothenate kinase [Limnobacter sp.]